MTHIPFVILASLVPTPMQMKRPGYEATFGYALVVLVQVSTTWHTFLALLVLGRVSGKGSSVIAC